MLQFCIKGLLKTGCGLVTAFCSCGYQIMQMAIPEVMVLTDMKHLSMIH
jgi:hypothetical protein